MNKHLLSMIWILTMLSFITLAGCAGDNEDEEVFPLNQPASASAAISVKAASYEDAADIDLFIKEASDDSFVALHNGDHISPGMKKLGIAVHGGTQTYDDVIVSQGGTAKTKAVLEGDTYTCSYNIDSEDIIQIILVEVMHPDGTASKKKTIIRTDPLVPETAIIKDEMGILLSAGLLDRFKTILPDMIPMLDAILPDMIPLEKIQFNVNELRPASQSAREKGAIMYVDLDLFNIPVFANFGLGQDMDIDTIPNLEMTLIDAVVGDGIFSRELPNWLIKFLNNNFLEIPSIDVALEDFFTLLGMDIFEDDLLAFMLDMLMNGDFLDFQNKRIMFGLYGLPEQTRDHAVAMGGWFLPLDDAMSVLGSDDLLENENIHAPLLLNPDNFTGDLGLNLSQDGLNQVVSLLIKEDPIAVGSEMFQLLFPDTLSKIMNNDSFDILLSLNPAGIGLDMKSSSKRLTANDIRVTFEQNGAAVWQISMDMQVAFDLQVHKELVDTESGDTEEHTMLDFYLTILPEKSHCHEIYDSLGMGMIDHTGILLILFEEIQKTFGAVPGGPFFSLDISKMGFELDQINVSSENGRCFFNVAIGDGMDLQQLVKELFSSIAILN